MNQTGRKTSSLYFVLGIGVLITGCIIGTGLLQRSSRAASNVKAGDSTDTERAAPGTPPARAAACEGRSIFRTVQHENGHTVRMWRTANLVGFKSNMDVNADGSPKAYNAQNTGLIDICNGYAPRVNGECRFARGSGPSYQFCIRKWREAVANGFPNPRSSMCIFGFGKDSSGRPLPQGPSDPAPGFFVSETSLKTVDGTPGTQSANVNGDVVSAVVVPGNWFDSSGHPRFGVNKGDVVWVFDQVRGTSAFAIVGDTGPSRRPGEGTIALHQALVPDDGTQPRFPFVFRHNGTLKVGRSIGNQVQFVFFPGSKARLGPIRTTTTNDDIKRVGEVLVAELGGIEAIKSCLIR